MKRLSEKKLLGLAILVFAILSIPNLSPAGQKGRGAYRAEGSSPMMLASYTGAPSLGHTPPPINSDNRPDARSGIFQIDTADSGPSNETSPGLVLDSGRFTRSVASPYNPSDLQSRYRLEPYRSDAFDFEFSSVLKGAGRGHFFDIGTAFATNVIIHELGHDIVADQVGADGSTLGFLQSRDGQFFFASSTVSSIDSKSRLPYYMGGEFAADFTFEYALKSYRTNPTLYNRSLMFFSGTEMLWYSMYAFYLSGGHDNLDPIAATKYGGVSREAFLSVAIAKTVMNAYRIYSGVDTVIPHFTIDDDSVTMNLTMAF